MLNKEDFKYKEFIKLQAAHNKLWEKLRNMPKVKLKEPYQRGWIVKYDVRDDIKSRNDYPIIKQLIEAGYYDSENNNVNAIKAIRRGDTQTRIKSSWGGLDHISHYYPKKRDISEKEYLEGGKIYEKYFILDTLSERYRKFGYKRYLISLPNYWLVLKVKPNIITHKTLKGGELEKEFQFIHDRLYNSGEFRAFYTNYSSSYPAYKDRGKVRTKISKFKNGIDDDIFNDKVPKEYHH